MMNQALAKKQEDNRALRDSRKNAVIKLFANTTGGLSIKEIAVSLECPAQSIRNYLKELVAEGQVEKIGNEGKTVIYGLRKGDAPVATEEIKEAFAEHHSGKEFDPDTIKPAIHVNQGDIVWASSRSGDGMFFRYLVITPWERKATVVGVLAEGDPVINLNDPRFVYLGEDPKSGEKLYADIANTCSRGYKQFGEDCMRVTAETMTEVKRVLARYYRLSDGSKEIERLKDENEDLRGKCKGLALECDEKKRAWDDMKKLADEALSTIDAVKKDCEAKVNELETKNKKLGILLDQTGKDIVDLEAENHKLKKQIVELDKDYKELQARNEELANFENTVPAPTSNTEDLLYYIGRLEEQLKGKDEIIAILKGIIQDYKESLDQALMALRR